MVGEAMQGVNMIAGPGSGVLLTCEVGGRLRFPTRMGNSSRGEVNVGGLCSGCLGIVECCFEAVGYFFWVWFSYFKVVMLQPYRRVSFVICG